MIISKTPYRISFFGGGTDFPDWYKEHGGSVISSTIDKHSYIILRKLPIIFDYNYRIRYYQREETKNIQSIKHPAVREAFKLYKIKDGLDLTHHGDLPARSGIGSSSSFSVGLLQALSVLNGTLYSKKDLAKNSIHFEQKILKESVGSQDQVAAVYGGFNNIDFSLKNEFICHSMPIHDKKIKLLEKHIQLFFTNVTRESSTIAKKKIDNIKNNKDYLNEMKSILEEAKKLILVKSSRNFISNFANLLNEQWVLKKKLEKSVTNNYLDSLYQKAIKYGAMGGKILGSGGGGFFLFLIPPDKQDIVKKKLQMKNVQVKLSKEGSEIIHYS